MDNSDILKNSDFEKRLIEHCSPTLASIKTGNLFWYSCSDETGLKKQISYWNGLLNPKGVYIVIFRQVHCRALVYVYRKERLRQELARKDVNSFLDEYGYGESDVDSAVLILKERIRSGSLFPHEIGLFLGYPLGDVIGFIKNKGEKCKCTGFWKVYCNKSDAEKTFERYRRCNLAYCRLWQNGRSIEQLTVA